MAGARNPITAKVPLSTRLAYGVGAVAHSAKDHGFSYFLLMFYSQVLGLSPAAASLALFLSLCVDAVADPLIGYWSDNLHSRWGRRHPFMYASVLPVVAGYWLLWHPPPGLSQTGLFMYLLILATSVRSVFTFYRVPSDALMPELTSDYDERTRLVGIRTLFAWLCGVTLAYLVYKVFMVDTPEHPDGILNPEGWGRYGTVASVLIAVGILASSLGTHRLIPGLPRPPPKEPFSFARTREYLARTLRNPSFLALFGSALLFAASAGISQTLNIYFSRYYWALSQDQLWFFSPVNLAAAAFGFWLVPRLTVRSNKQTVAIRTWMFAALFLPVPVILRLLGWFPAPGSDLLLDLLLVHSFIEILVITIGYILVHSMMADLVEDNEKDTGRRSEGLYFSSLSFAAKTTTGLGIVMAGLILEVVDFPVGAAFGEVPEPTMTAFGVIGVGAMVFFYVLATWVLRHYRITREGHERNLAILATAKT